MQQTNHGENMRDECCFLSTGGSKKYWCNMCLHVFDVNDYSECPNCHATVLTPEYFKAKHSNSSYGSGNYGTDNE